MGEGGADATIGPRMTIYLINSPLVWPPQAAAAPSESDEPFPLGLISLATYLRANGFASEIIDLWSPESSAGSLLEVLSAGPPELIGINVTGPTLPATLQLGTICKTHFPEVPIVVGGAHASSAPESLLERSYPFDYVVAGEGEKALLDLACRVRDRRLDSLSSRIIHHPQAGDLSEFGIPDFSVLPVEQYFSSSRELPVSSSRGCDYTCSYCAISRVYGSRVRRKPVDQLRSEVREYVDRYACDSIRFVSENLVAGQRDYLHALSSMLGGEGVRWRCQFRVTGLKVEDVPLLKGNGCIHVLFGIDVFSENSQRISNRTLHIPHTNEMAAALVKHGIESEAVFIVGFPGDSLKDVLGTLTYAHFLKHQLGVQQITFYPLILFPGTKLWAQYGRGCRFGGFPMPSGTSSPAIRSYVEKRGLVPEVSAFEDKNEIGRLMAIVLYCYEACNAASPPTESDLRDFIDQNRGFSEEIDNYVHDLESGPYL